MKSGWDWLAANDHSKGEVREPRQEWVRSAGETWFRPMTSRAECEGISSSWHRLIATSEIVGLPVFAPDGRRLGRLVELTFDESTGKIAEVVLASGGVLGFGERRHRASWSRLSYDSESDRYVLAPTDPDDGGASAALNAKDLERPTDRRGEVMGA